MLPHEYRLRTRHDITSAMRRGRRRTSTRLVVHIAFGDRPGPARAAFAVSSAIGNSVVRHRLTRQLRAALTPLLPRLPQGTDVVIRALPAARGASYPDLVADLEHCLQQDLITPEVRAEPTPPPTETLKSVVPQPESAAAAENGMNWHNWDGSTALRRLPTVVPPRHSAAPAPHRSRHRLSPGHLTGPSPDVPLSPVVFGVCAGIPTGPRCRQGCCSRRLATRPMQSFQQGWARSGARAGVVAPGHQPRWHPEN